MTTAVAGYLKVKSDFFNINWKIVCILGLLACMPLLALYVWQINDLTKGAYVINNYESQIKNLSEENKSLEVSFAASSFLDEALKRVQSLNFEKTTSVKYIQILEGSAKSSELNKKI